MPPSAKTFRGILGAVFKITGRGTLLAFEDGWSGNIIGGQRIVVGGTELLVRGVNVHAPRDFKGPHKISMLVGDGHHEFLLGCLGEEVTGV
jgi:hypothetical protein